MRDGAYNDEGWIVKFKKFADFPQDFLEVALPLIAIMKLSLNSRQAHWLDFNSLNSEILISLP